MKTVKYLITATLALGTLTAMVTAADTQNSKANLTQRVIAGNVQKGQKSAGYNGLYLSSKHAPAVAGSSESARADKSCSKGSMSVAVCKLHCQ